MPNAFANTVDNEQASLPLTVMVQMTGIYPARDDDGTEDPTAIPLGSLRISADGYAWSGTGLAGGQLLSINSNQALFSLLGTFYGGNGTSNFGLPNLVGATAIDVGQGAGLSYYGQGQVAGSANVGLTNANLPSSVGGQGIPFTNVGPSLAINYVISSGASFTNTGDDMPGEILPFLGNFAPDGYLECNGQLLNIADYPNLFVRIGTIYGGDGKTTFRLPDLRGRAPIGASATDSIGSMAGQETNTVTTANLPTTMGGTDAALDNRQPTLAVNYLISLYGIFPTQGGGGNFSNSTPYVGEIIPYAGAYIPAGWALCDGSLMNITDNEVLFNLIGTTYGGNGTTTFALPDLRDRIVVGAGAQDPLGNAYGSNTITLNPSQVPLAHRRSDFNGDYKSDILMQNATNGQAQILEMNGTAVLAGSGKTSSAPGAGYTIVGSGDFDGDGKADILMLDPSSGHATIWFMDGTTRLAGSGQAGTSRGAGYAILGAADFDGDGRSDILWQNTVTGQVSVWLMNGTAKQYSGNVGAALTSDWSFVGTGDFDGDGKADIVFQNNATGAVKIWLMDGLTKTGGGSLAGTSGTGHQIVGIGDFNGDGKSDLLWETTATGALSIWFMDGMTRTSHDSVANLPSGFQVAATGDYNGDGKSDILLQNTSTGQMQVWLMNGVTQLAGSGVITGSPSSAWHAVSG